MASIQKILLADVQRPPLHADAEVLRPEVRGKFLFVGSEKLFLRGVTYGPFRSEVDGSEYGDLDTVERDFAEMGRHGINTVRTYTTPPRWVLDAAARHGLRVMVGLAWEQHVTFLDDGERARAIEAGIRESVRSTAGHPGVLCHAVGNEIPASIVRWHGRRRIERFIERLYRAVKEEDPGALVTYVNYPTTEYLQLPFLDLAAFNVYLEDPATSQAYLDRLQALAGDRPLVMAEVGLDSRRNGLDAQAASLDWQVRAAFTAGCAGVFVFKWTDTWHRGGHEIDDWDFGLTDRERRPKPALEVVRAAYAETPFPPGPSWPSVTVVVCTYNGSGTLRETLDALTALDYPSFDVIVVDDGSTDGSARIAQEFDVRLLRMGENRGLSAARNAGLEAARGEIVAYLDDDAYPDPHWLRYLALTYEERPVLAAGGPNLAPPSDGVMARAVARAPGNPTHVLLSDGEAEHIPGCSFSFRRDALLAIGGFDERFRIAGDDVDACWRLQERGSIGYSPAALVWHHPRGTVATYWRQQRNYGRAEALLEAKWPQRYNVFGHYDWGRLSRTHSIYEPRPFTSSQVRYGVWGTRLFQSLYERSPGTLLSLPLTPEWYLVLAALSVLCLLGLTWTPLLVGGVTLLSLATAILLWCAGWRTRYAHARRASVRVHALSFCLCLLQPLARLCGRLSYGLHPWRGTQVARALPIRRTVSRWSEASNAPEGWISGLEARLRQLGARVRRGGEFDRWDLEVRSGLLAAVRALGTIEEHGGGRQMIRFRLWPRTTRSWRYVAVPLVLLVAIAACCSAWGAAAALSGVLLLLGLRTVLDGALAMGACLSALDRLGEAEVAPECVLPTEIIGETVRQ